MKRGTRLAGVHEGLTLQEWATDARSVFVPPPHRRVAQREVSAQMWRQAAPKRTLVAPLSARTRCDRPDLEPVAPLTSRPALQKRSVPIRPRLQVCEDARRFPHPHANTSASDHSSDRHSILSQHAISHIPRALALRQARHIEAFHTVAMIGQGGYAVVRVVKHKETGLVCALKQIAKSDFVNEAQLRMAFTEVDILSAREKSLVERRNGLSVKGSDVRIGEIRNPKEKAYAIRKLVERDGAYYFPEFYACWQDEHFIYFLMEYLPGGDLMKHLIDKEIFPEKMAKFYAAQIAIALGYMHDHLHYVHRDVKPDNVLFDARGHTKLVDFGLSRLLPRTDRHGCFTESFQSAVGTPDYMAPEVHRPAQPHDRSIDWWSLGIILYEMLFGGPPLSDLQHRPEVTSQLIRNWKQFLTSFPKHPLVSNAAKDLLHRLIAERQDRFRTVEEVLAHPWFDSLDLENFRRLRAPIVPQTSGEADVRNFDSFSLSKLIQWEEKKRRGVLPREIAFALNEMRTKRRANAIIPFASERPSTADGSASSSSCAPSLSKARSVTQQAAAAIPQKTRLVSTSESSSAFPSSSDDTLVLPAAQPKRLASPRGGLLISRERAMCRRPAVPKMIQTNEATQILTAQNSLLSGIKTAVTRWLTTSSSGSSSGVPPPTARPQPNSIRAHLTATGSQCSPRRTDLATPRIS